MRSLLMSGLAAGLAGIAATAGQAAETAPDGALIVRGEIGAGVECPILTAADGTVYSLTGAGMAFTVGAYVEVTGAPAEVSICMQGQTLSVSAIRPVAPPN